MESFEKKAKLSAADETAVGHINSRAFSDRPAGTADWPIVFWGRLPIDKVFSWNKVQPTYPLFHMPYLRRQPSIPPSQGVSVRLNVQQRDLLIASNKLGQKLGYALHHAPVRGGKLSLRLKKTELETVISAAAQISPADTSEDHLLRSLLKYLEELEDRFEDASSTESSHEGEPSTLDE